MESLTTAPVAPRAATINALAVIGFVALIGGSIWLANYSTRYVPLIADRVGSAAVYLGSFFSPEPSTLVVVPTPIATTTLPSTPATTTPATTTPVTKPVKPVATTPGLPTTTTYPISGTPAAPTLSGLPDLVVEIKAVGYLASSSAESFVATSTTPYATRPAVKFSIKNVGTNIAGTWRFSAAIPTQTGYVFSSQTQQPLAPGDSIEYVLGFDQAITGTGKMISITANPDRTLLESKTDNNSASATLTILGS